MGHDLVFVPVTAEEAQAIVDGATLAGPRPGFAATPELVDTFGLRPDEDEEAEHSAVLLASLAGLIATGRRLVVVAEGVGVSPAEDPAARANGGVVVGDLPSSRCTAWFGDETDEPTRSAVAVAAALVEGLDLDPAWALPEVQSLLARHDLLWHGMAEPVS